MKARLITGEIVEGEIALRALASGQAAPVREVCFETADIRLSFERAISFPQTI